MRWPDGRPLVISSGTVGWPRSSSWTCLEDSDKVNWSWDDTMSGEHLRASGWIVCEKGILMRIGDLNDYIVVIIVDHSYYHNL